jgi:RimJ/RimL family protein N-acetyltransferase
MNADPAVMEHFPAPLSGVESSALIDGIERCFEERGYGLWALEMPGVASFVGFTGLAPVDEEMVFAPAVELGWRLARPFWGRGLAGEAAAAAVRFAFEDLGLPSLVSFTVRGNTRSRRVMERLQMTRNPAEDFLHPGLRAADPLAAHVLYRLEATRWRISSKGCAGATPTPPDPKN